MKGKLILYTLVAAIGGLLYGFDTAVINGALPFFKAHFQLNDIMTGWAVSSALVGCIIGAIGVGKPGDRYGRRQMLKLSAFLFLISALGTGLAPEITSFIVFRFIGGLAVGAASVLSPMYISEIAPPTHRGRLIVTFQLALVIGILLAFFVDYLLIDCGQNNWRYMFMSEAIPSLIFMILLFRVGKSPRWLVQKGNYEQAQLVIQQVNPLDESENIIREIRETIAEEKKQQQEKLFKKPNLKFTLIGICIGLYSQLTGVAIVFYYATDIFRAAGFSTDSAIGQTVILGLTNLTFTLLAMKFIDRIGRKTLLYYGTLGMAIALGVFSWAFYMGQTSSWILIIVLIVYVAFFASSMGAVVFVLLAEVFPNNIRSRGVAVGSFSNWMVSGVITFLFPVVTGMFDQGKGVAYSFAFFSVMTFSGFFFFKKYLFETTNKSLEEIERENK
ncbi:sugar porter family MFS transporter [Carboxylicivirga mesophila]|uniref:Sugar porter family MFS transporter n=1 Tax=Carboxylicivirga mesophila TaxID=1166478 RepID=A0ABS5KCL7_9BACT|nr:sugar porter family MFS transporter [Carboxylicivirga mesophila]